MWHSHKGSDVRSKRFKIVVALATGLYWMSSGTVSWQTGPFTLLSSASAESLSVPPKPTPSARSTNQTPKLTRRPSADKPSAPPSQSTSPSTSSNQTQNQNKLIRRPSKPQVPATSSSPSTATVKSSDKTPIASSA